MKISPEIVNLKAYVPGKPIEETKREFGIDTVYKLASNENPLGVSQRVMEAMRKSLEEIHRYPDPSFFQLKEKFSKKFQQDKDCISFGNGSNEIIDLLVRIFCEPGSSILTMEAAFVAYPVCAQAARVKTEFVPMNPDSLKVSVESMISAWKPEHRVVFLPNPNNPTGSYFNQSEVEKLIHFFANKEDVLLVFDEAYVEYATASDYVSALKYRGLYKNLAVIRTLSKAYGLAGLRVGCLFASPEVVALYDKVRNPFNVNSVAQAAALAAIDDQEYLDKAKENNQKGLELFYQEFEKENIKYWKSQANFVLFDCGREAGPFVQALMRKGLILRPVANYGMPNYIRLSVGSWEENQLAIQWIAEEYKKGKA